MVQQGMKVTMAFKMKDETGHVWDEATKEQPFQYTHGKKELLNILEQGIEGKRVGDIFAVTISPEQAYGLRDESLVYTFPKAHFKDIKDLKIGMLFQPSLDPNISFKVIGIDEDKVIVDANHPLAGKTLTFEVELLAVEKLGAQ